MKLVHATQFGACMKPGLVHARNPVWCTHQSLLPPHFRWLLLYMLRVFICTQDSTSTYWNDGPVIDGTDCKALTLLGEDVWSNLSSLTSVI